jgi:hypothetical protein
VVERGRASDGFDFSIPVILSKGDLEVIVDNDRAGRLSVCFVELEDRVSRWASYDVRAGLPRHFRVVDGQRYQVHAHLEFPGGHLESESFVFTASTGKTAVRLRPDAPRALHR